LVRGAYLSKEPPEAVARSKEETDRLYDNTVTHLIQNRTNALLIASHNHHSILNAFHLLQSGKVAHGRNVRTICFGQLYGMGNDITYGLVQGLNKISLTPHVQVSVIKYIPYGGIRDVMPYLVRRAEENRGMLGGSILEREALFVELKRRTGEFLGIGLKVG
jgi:proline dehydrogenase